MPYIKLDSCLTCPFSLVCVSDENALSVTILSCPRCQENKIRVRIGKSDDMIFREVDSSELPLDCPKLKRGQVKEVGLCSDCSDKGMTKEENVRVEKAVNKLFPSGSDIWQKI